MLRKPRRLMATIQRQVNKIALEQGWEEPSYAQEYRTVKELLQGLMTLAKEGGGSYREVYELLYRREAARSNEIWQAALIEAAQRELAGELEIRQTSTGLHVMGWLLPGVNDQQVWELALAQGIDTPPLSAHAMNQQPRGGLVLGYACVSPPEIRRGVDLLAMAFQHLEAREEVLNVALPDNATMLQNSTHYIMRLLKGIVNLKIFVDELLPH